MKSRSRFILMLVWAFMPMAMKAQPVYASESPHPQPSTTAQEHDRLCSAKTSQVCVYRERKINTADVRIKKGSEIYNRRDMGGGWVAVTLTPCGPTKFIMENDATSWLTGGGRINCRLATKPKNQVRASVSAEQLASMKVVQTNLMGFTFGIKSLAAAEVQNLPVTKVAQVSQAGRAVQQASHFSLCPLEPNRPICYFKFPDMNSFLDTLPRGSNVWDPQPVRGNPAFQSVKIHRQDSDKERVYVLAKDLAKGSGRLIPSVAQEYVIPPRHVPIRKDQPAVAPKPAPARVVAKKDTVVRVRVDTVHAAGKTEVRFVHDTTIVEHQSIRKEGMSWKPIIIGAATITALGVAACIIWKCGSSSTSTSTSTSYSGSLSPAVPQPMRPSINLHLRF